MAEWRIVYKSTWGDKKIRALSEVAELHFIKLISVADDHGYIDGDEVLAQCYPRRPEITEEEIERRNLELAASDPDDPVLVVYKICARTILFLPKFLKLQKTRKDRLKDSDLAPLVDSCQPLVVTCQPVADNCGEMPPTHHITSHHITSDKEIKDHAASPRLLKTAKEQNPLPPDFNLEGFLIGSVKAGWVLRFGRIQHPNIKLLIERCRKRGISPIHLLDYTKNHAPNDALKYVQSLIRKEGGLWPENGDGTYDAWEESIINNKRGVKPRRAKNPRGNQEPTRLGDLV